MGKLGIEARVGAFVLGALAILVGFVLALGDFSFRSGVIVHADFAFTSGLQEGAPVMLSGIRVGKVNDLSLLGGDPQPPAASPKPKMGQRRQPLVRADLEIDRELAYLFADDSQLHIGTQGVIGESYVEVTPGGGPTLTADRALRGVDAPRLHVMTLHMSTLLSAAGALVGDVDEDGGELGEVGGAVATLLGNINSLVGEHRDELGQAMTDLAAASSEFRALLSEVRAAMDQGRAVEALVDDSGAVMASIRSDLPGLITQAKNSLTAVESLTQKADRITNPEDLQAIITDVKGATSRLDRITRDTEALLKGIRRGEGTVGGLMQDPQIYDDIKELFRDLKQHPWKFLWRD